MGMPAHKKLKSRNLRGHISHGHGRAGKCGGLKHLKTNFTKYHPDYFGKKGMNIFHRKKNLNFTRTVSVNRIWSHVEFTENRMENQNLKLKAANSEEEVPVVDLRNTGIDRVLGGKLSCESPIVVIASSFSGGAVQEIERVGGKCVVAA